jgi:hypothetical protein
MTLKVRILPFLTTFAQLSARLKNFLRGWLLVLGIKEGLVKGATVCVKSVVILYYRYLFVKKKVFNWSELHFSEVTFYKIHTLRINLVFDTGKLLDIKMPGSFHLSFFVFRHFWRRSYQNQLSFSGKDSTADFFVFRHGTNGMKRSNDNSLISDQNCTTKNSNFE